MPEEKENESAPNPTFDSKDVEKIYENVLLSREGDVFRVGFFAKTDQKKVVEVFLASSLLEKAKVGEIEISPSQEGKYQAILLNVERLSLTRYRN